jgi:hypothetical protein
LDVSDPKVLVEIVLQFLILEFVSVIHLEELQLGAFLKLDLVILRSVI